MKFDFEKVDDFEKHIELSIPNFLTLDNIFKNIAHEFAQPESVVVDFGCSTGRFLSAMNKTKGCVYKGIDSVDMRQRRNDFEFIHGDCEKDYLDMIEDNVSVLVSMFFLQFLGQSKRQRVLDHFKLLIDAGAALLISEKVYLDDPQLQQSIHRMHIQEKRKGFTDQEILDKDLQLSVSMFCKTESELEYELKNLGKVSKVWQSYNFMGFVVKRS